MKRREAGTLYLLGVSSTGPGDGLPHQCSADPKLVRRCWGREQVRGLEGRSRLDLDEGRRITDLPLRRPTEGEEGRGENEVIRAKVKLHKPEVSRSQLKKEERIPPQLKIFLYVVILYPESFIYDRCTRREYVVLVWWWSKAWVPSVVVESVIVRRTCVWDGVLGGLVTRKVFGCSYLFPDVTLNLVQR